MTAERWLTRFPLQYAIVACQARPRLSPTRSLDLERGFSFRRAQRADTGVEASQDATADVENLVSLIMVLSKEKKVPLPFVAGRIGRPAMRLGQLHWWIGVRSQCGSGL